MKLIRMKYLPGGAVAETHIEFADEAAMKLYLAEEDAAKKLIREGVDHDEVWARAKAACAGKR